MGETGLIRGQKQQLTEEEQRMAAAVEMFTDLLAPGDLTHAQLARKLAKGDKHKAKMIRQRIRRLAARPDFQLAYAIKTKATSLLSVGPALNALGERAIETGRPDAVKLLLEVTGVHAPRVDHHHEGDIQITLNNVPRPTPVANEEPVVDADVVED